MNKLKIFILIFFLSLLTSCSNRAEYISDEYIKPNFVEIYKIKRMFVEIGKEWDYARYPVEFNRKLAFIGGKNDKEYIVYPNGSIESTFGDIEYLTIINSKMAYVFGRYPNFSLVYDGKVIVENFDHLQDCNIGGNLHQIVDIHGKPAFTAAFRREKTYEYTYKIFYDDTLKELDYDFVSCPILIGEKVAYSVWNNSIKRTYLKNQIPKKYIIYDGKEFGKEFESVDSEPFDVNGKIGYIVEDDCDDNYVKYGIKQGRHCKKYVIVDSIKLPEEFEEVDDHLTIGDQIYVFYSLDDTQYLKNGDQVRKLKGALLPHSVIKNIDGKLAYVLYDGDLEEDTLIYNGKEVGKEDLLIIDVIGKAGKIAYIVAFSTKGGYEFNKIVYNGRDLALGYQNGDKLTFIGNNLAFEVEDSEGRGYILMEKE